MGHQPSGGVYLEVWNCQYTRQSLMREEKEKVGGWLSTSWLLGRGKKVIWVDYLKKDFQSFSKYICRIQNNILHFVFKFKIA